MEKGHRDFAINEQTVEVSGPRGGDGHETHNIKKTVRCLAHLQYDLVVAIILCIVPLACGTTPRSNNIFSLLTFNVTGLPDTSIGFVKLRLFTTCFGPWNAEGNAPDWDRSSCQARPYSYSFCLQQYLQQNHAAPLHIDPSYGCINVKTPTVLLVVATCITTLSAILLAIGITWMVRSRSLRKPIMLLRATFITSIAALNLMLISSAQINIHADHISGTHEVASDVFVKAWMDPGTYTFMWSATSLLIIAFLVCMRSAFVIMRELEAAN